MGASTYLEQTPVVKINLAGAKLSEPIHSCKDKECGNHGKKLEGNFCSLCGSALETVNFERDVQIDDLIYLNEDYELRFFQEFGKDENCYSLQYDSNNLDKDRTRDIYVYDDGISKYNGNFRNRYVKIFEPNTPEKNKEDIVTFIEKHSIFISKLKEWKIQSEISTKILVSSS